jgi:hypothetical protein
MFKFSTQSTVFALKILSFLISIVVLVYYISRFITYDIPLLILQEYGLSIDVLSLLNKLPLQGFLLTVFCFLLLVAWFITDVVLFLKSINLEIKESLKDRKLERNFEHLFVCFNFFKVSCHLKTVFHLYKMLDNMKTSRIVLEVSTLRQLMAQIKKGVILIRKDLVVTHVNHIAEGFLGLISGEIINQSISRKIDNEDMLHAIENGFEFDKKILDIHLEKENLTMSMFPLKDKFGEVVRVLIVMDKWQERPIEPIKVV